MATRVAVVLVAGVGSRLRPLTDDRPKALVSLGAETLFGRTLRMLTDHGVRKLVLATGYREDAVRAALVDWPLELALCRNARFDSTQNSVSLWLCRDAVGGEAFFKLDGDVVFQPPVLARLDASQAPLSVAVDESRAPDAEAMKVRLANGRQISSFGKAIPVAEAAGESIGIERVGESAVVPLFDALEARIRGGEEQLYYEDIYSELIAGGGLSAEAVPVGDLPWTEIDTPEDLARAKALVAAEH
jgi:choline kinase